MVTNWFALELMQCACEQRARSWQSKVRSILGNGGDSIVFHNIDNNSGGCPLLSWLPQLHLYWRGDGGQCCFWTHPFVSPYNYPQWNPTCLIRWALSSLWVGPSILEMDSHRLSRGIGDKSLFYLSFLWLERPSRLQYEKRITKRSKMIWVDLTLLWVS